MKYYSFFLLVFGNMLLSVKRVRSYFPHSNVKYLTFQSQTKFNTVGVVKTVKTYKINNNESFLSADERELFSLFREIVRDENINTTVRVAGGWVRDKLLGRLGKFDIDIALDNMTGQEFTVIMNQWFLFRGKKSFKVGIIRRNPEKSKHLETATVQIGCFSLDFVNLRCESYAETSRIPVMTIGTPLEDAIRRDLTINSLFYNIITNEIEDFTTQGISDLQQGLLRTPLDPLVTLVDDPLRVLRTVRFAARFQFSIITELYLAAQKKIVRDALESKVSRDRIKDEFFQMLSGENSARAIGILHALDLLTLVIKLPPVHTEVRQTIIDEEFKKRNRSAVGQSLGTIESYFRGQFHRRGVIRVYIFNVLKRTVQEDKNVRGMK